MADVVLTIFSEVKLIGNSIPNILNYIFFLFKVYGFYHIKEEILELSMQAVRLRLEPKKCFFSWSYSYFVSTRCLKFSSIYFFLLIYKKNLSLYRNVFNILQEQFCRLSFVNECEMWNIKKKKKKKKN